MHLNKLRPRPVHEFEKGKPPRKVPQNGQLEVANLTNDISAQWQAFIGDSVVAPYAKLTAHIDNWARHGAAATRIHLTKLLDVADSAMWHPPNAA